MEKHTLRLYTGDYEKLMALYPDIGAAKSIRDLVHLHIRKIEEDAAQKLTPIIDMLDIQLLEDQPHE